MSTADSPPRHHRPLHRRRSAARTRLLALGTLAVVVVIVVVALVLSGVFSSGPSTGLGAPSTTTTLPPSSSSTTSSVPRASSTSTTRPSTSTTTSTSSTTTTTVAPTTTTVPVDLVTPSSVLVEVLNGSGGSGAAQAVASSLHAAGFTINGTGDANDFSYGTSVIAYAPGNLAGAETLAHHVEGATHLEEVNNLPASDEVELIIGSSFSGVAS